MKMLMLMLMLMLRLNLTVFRKKVLQSSSYIFLIRKGLEREYFQFINLASSMLHPLLLHLRGGEFSCFKGAIFALAFLISNLTFAADNSVSATESGISWWQLFKVILALALVLVLIVAVILTLKRLQSKSPMGGGKIEALGGLALGPRRSLQLIKAGSRIFLIGVTDHHLSPIAEFSDPNEIAYLSRESKTPPIANFSDILQRLWGRKPRNP